MWQQWVNGVLGIWIIAVPFLGLSAAQNLWVLAITGLVIAILGFWGAIQHRTMHEEGHSMSRA
ncbi:MAG: hypothetical protein JWM56_750 [Candidatus Peribacteria bacterium]|nr:hypothetical protein [Candidatus Peribacteria bacterium]